jgi:hypothetical protein
MKSNNGLSSAQFVAMLNPELPFIAMGAVGFTRATGRTHWLTRDGIFMRPDQMTHEHKLNCIRMVANNRRTRALLMCLAIDAMRYAVDAPDGAADAATEYADDVMRSNYADRVDFVLKRSPVLAEMARYLRIYGIDPRRDYGGVLGDGELLMVGLNRNVRRVPNEVQTFLHSALALAGGARAENYTRRRSQG